jgi:LacI family transcriptional regulator, galactose operon repressor
MTRSSAETDAMVTIRDVARESGFSPTTVSMVLNRAPLARYISGATKKRVVQVAQRLGYQPNPFARALRSRRSHTIGVMVPDIADPYCTQILRGIESSLSRSSFLPLLVDIQNNRLRFKNYLIGLLARRVEGLIILANSLYFETELLAALESRKIPSVILGRQPETAELNWVATDNEAGAQQALEHLYRLGHRKIAFIRGPKMIFDSHHQWAGICTFAATAGLSLDPRLVATLTNPFSSYEGGYKHTKELLALGLPFTALVAFDDLTAFGAIRALTSAGRRVPADCSVIGFDDIPAAAFYNPALTSVREGMQGLGSMGGEILIEAIRAHRRSATRPAVHRKVRPELIVRESTAAPPRDFPTRGGQKPRRVHAATLSS